MLLVLCVTFKLYTCKGSFDGVKPYNGVKGHIMYNSAHGCEGNHHRGVWRDISHYGGVQ